MHSFCSVEGLLNKLLAPTKYRPTPTGGPSGYKAQLFLKEEGKMRKGILWAVFMLMVFGLGACLGGGGTHNPVANAGADQKGKVNTVFTLDGSGSSGINLLYSWTLTSTPPGSTATLSGATSANPTIRPDVGGVYVAKLVVTDDNGLTDSDTVTITAGVLFPEYQPGVSSNCTWTYQWTLGRTGIFSTSSGTQTTVNYTSGALAGRIIGMAQDISFLEYNDGTTFNILGFNTGGANTYISTDCNMTAHHPGWSYDIVYNGMIKDQTGSYFVLGGNPANCTGPDNTQKILFTVQDVTVQGVQYNNAILHWYIDLQEPFTPVSNSTFTNVGIISPTSTQTGGRSLTSLDIYAPGVGLVASGDIEALSGTLNNFAEMTSHTCN